jgi:glucose-6-phosphate dehydrogenase assembly protein OpcA
MIGLWDTTGREVVRALSAERRSAGGVTSGLALSLIVVVDEKRVREAEAAATIAAAAHPCRLLVVVRNEPTRQESRLDAEIVVGGRLGPCEAVVIRW